MQLHQLRYVVSVARVGSFSRAAEECHVSQPSLSQQVMKLEDELGERLFHRLRREVKLTPQGELFLVRAERILAEVEAARREAVEAGDLTRGLVRVGVLPTVAPYLLPKVLPRFSRGFPGIELVVQEGTTAQLLSLLAARDIDLAIASEPLHDSRIQTEPLFTEELLLALPPHHPLLKKRSIRASDLESERFIVMKEGHCLGDQVLNFCSGRNVHVNVWCRSAQVETICALVQVGLGISLIPAMASQTPRSPSLEYRALSPPKPRRKVVALWPRGHSLANAPGALLQHIRESMATEA